MKYLLNLKRIEMWKNYLPNNRVLSCGIEQSCKSWPTSTCLLTNFLTRTQVLWVLHDQSDSKPTFFGLRVSVSKIWICEWGGVPKPHFRGHVTKGQAWACILEFGTPRFRKSDSSVRSSDLYACAKYFPPRSKTPFGAPLRKDLREGPKSQLWALVADARLVRTWPYLMRW